MKKFTSILLGATLTLGLGACSNNTSSSSTAGASSEEKSQLILIGISPDYPPYESKSTSGEIEGFDPEMTAWIFNYLNENGHNYTYEFEELSFDTIISSLQAGQIDLGISGFTYDENRQGIFSDSYYDSAQVIVVAEDSDVTSAADLNGKTVGAQQGATGEQAAATIEGAKVTATSDANLMLETLKAHGIDAVVIDKAVADKYVSEGGYKIVGEDLMEEENIIYSTAEHQELMDQINEAIQAFKESDDYQVLVTKWFGTSAEAE